MGKIKNLLQNHSRSQLNINSKRLFYYGKITKKEFLCTCHFGLAYATHIVMGLLRVQKVVIKTQYIIFKQKQGYILATIHQDTAEKDTFYICTFGCVPAA